MDVMQAITQRRSIRRFTQEPVAREVLEAVANAARLSPTGMNLQPLQFAIISQKALCEQIFPHTAWAKRIPDGSAGPTEATQPTAYVAILIDKELAKASDVDAGAAAMSIMIAAESFGVASCWLGSLDRKEILNALSLDESRYALHTLVALGHPAMQSRAVPMQGNEIGYYLESPDVLCVPKRAKEDILHWYE